MPYLFFYLDKHPLHLVAWAKHNADTIRSVRNLDRVHKELMGISFFFQVAFKKFGPFEKLAPLVVVWLPNGELRRGTTVVVIQLVLCLLKRYSQVLRSVFIYSRVQAPTRSHLYLSYDFSFLLIPPSHLRAVFSTGLVFFLLYFFPRAHSVHKEDFKITNTSIQFMGTPWHLVESCSTAHAYISCSTILHGPTTALPPTWHKFCRYRKYSHASSPSLGVKVLRYKR